MTTDESIQNFLNKMREKVPHGKLQIRVTGGEPAMDCPLSKDNERKVLRALDKQEDLDIMSWDTRKHIIPILVLMLKMVIFMA